MHAPQAVSRASSRYNEVSNPPPASAGMLALRRDATVVRHEDFVEGTQAVQMKKKSELSYVS